MQGPVSQLRTNRSTFDKNPATVSLLIAFEVVSEAMESQGSVSGKVQILYYLSREGQLEQPHLLELSISGTDGLSLRDVKEQLRILRGKTMPVSFSWSCRRTYKNGYVWQDLSDDDLIFPADGGEYVLKGSRIPDPFQKEWPTTDGQENYRTVDHMTASKTTVLEGSVDSDAYAENLRCVESRNPDIIFEFEQTRVGLTSMSETSDCFQKQKLGLPKVLTDEGMRKREVAKPQNLHEEKVYMQLSSSFVGSRGPNAATQAANNQERISTRLDPDTENSRRKQGVVFKSRELQRASSLPLPYSSRAARKGSSTSSCEKDGRIKETFLMGAHSQHRKHAKVEDPDGSSVHRTSSTNDDHSVRAVQARRHCKSTTNSGAFPHLVSCGGLEVKEPEGTSLSQQEIVGNFCFAYSKKWPKPRWNMPVVPIISKNNGINGEVSHPQVPDSGNPENGKISLSLGRRESQRYSDQHGVALPEPLRTIIDQRPSANSNRSSNALNLQNRTRRSDRGYQREPTPVFGTRKAEGHGRAAGDSLGSSTVSPSSGRDDNPAQQAIVLSEPREGVAMSSERFATPSQSTNRALKRSLTHEVSVDEAKSLILWEELLDATKNLFKTNQPA